MKFEVNFIRTTLTLFALGIVNFLFVEKNQAASIQHQLHKHIPKVIGYLNENQLKTVGVLKFRVKKPAEKTSSSAGSLNSQLADRLEVGLILANPFDERRQLNIIKDASAKAAKIDKASHLTVAGRKAFFGPRFKLAWGNQSVVADAFLTGIVQVHNDNQRASVGILCFNKSGEKLERACEVFEVELDAETLGGIGESFLLRGASDESSAQLTLKESQKQKQQMVLTEVVKVKTEQVKFPLFDPAAPVKLEVFYDGQPVAIEMRQGRAFVSEPRAGQKVEMALVRNRSAGGRLGIVLKVNGENTLYRQVMRDFDCTKWILSPDYSKTVVRGYQMKDHVAEKFIVLSKAESAERAMDYGRQVGQIQMTVFQELSAAKPILAMLDEDEQDLAAMLRGVQPTKQPKNLAALKHQIRLAGRKGSQARGLIVQGAKTANKVETVTFNTDPTPVMSVTINYYKP